MQQVQPEQEEGIPVSLNVYDVTNAASDSTNTTIVRINNVTRSLGVGGVFHGAVVMGNVELSFGFCERGTGVYSCPIGKNPMYTYRENIDLGSTKKSREEIKEILHRLRQQWPGLSYDLLSRNCCHFCDELCKELGVKPTPLWLNRFASNADATIHFTSEAVTAVKGIGSELSRVTNESLGYLRASWQRTSAPALPQPPASTTTTPLLPGDGPQTQSQPQPQQQQPQPQQPQPQLRPQSDTDGSCSPRGGPGIGSLIASSGSRFMSSTRAFFSKVAQEANCGPNSIPNVEYRLGEKFYQPPSSLQSHLPGSKHTNGQPSSTHSQQELPPNTEHSLLIPKQPKLGGSAAAAAGDAASDVSQGDSAYSSAGGDLDIDDDVSYGAPGEPNSSQQQQRRSNLGIARSGAVVPGPAPGVLLGHGQS